MATYTDDFNRPDSTNIGNWTEFEDNWSIVSNQLAPGITQVSYVLYGSPLDTSDHYAEIVFSTAIPSSMGVVARSDASGSTFYVLRGNSSNWTIFANIAGNFTSIGSYGVGAATGDVVRIQCVGSTIKGFINGIERISATDTSIPVGLYAGARCEASSTARYDNFVASDIGGTVAATGAFLGFMQ